MLDEEKPQLKHISYVTVTNITVLSDIIEQELEF